MKEWKESKKENHALTEIQVPEAIIERLEQLQGAVWQAAVDEAERRLVVEREALKVAQAQALAEVVEQRESVAALETEAEMFKAKIADLEASAEAHAITLHNVSSEFSAAKELARTDKYAAAEALLKETNRADAAVDRAQRAETLHDTTQSQSREDRDAAAKSAREDREALKHEHEAVIATLKIEIESARAAAVADVKKAEEAEQKALSRAVQAEKEAQQRAEALHDTAQSQAREDREAAAKSAREDLETLKQEHTAVIAALNIEIESARAAAVADVKKAEEAEQKALSRAIQSEKEAQKLAASELAFQSRLETAQRDVERAQSRVATLEEKAEKAIQEAAELRGELKAMKK